jgi:hypothetical protein
MILAPNIPFSRRCFYWTHLQQPKASVIKTIHASEVESKEKVVSETNSNKQRKAYPRQEARSHENSYRSRIQTVSTSRMSATGNELTPKGSASTEEQAHSKVRQSII